MVRFAFHGRPWRGTVPLHRKPLLFSALIAALVAITANRVAATDSPASATPSAIEANLAAFQLQNAHLAEILFRMLVASDALCDTHMPLTGMEIQDESQFSPAFRDAATRFFRLGHGPAILSIVPGSPADKAGLKVDDAILLINGEAPQRKPDAARGKSVEARVATIRQISAQLDGALARGPVTLTILRGDDTLQVALTAVSGCQTKLDFTLEGKMNSRADGLFISIPSKLVEYTRDDDELAVIVGHELSHNVQHDYDLFGNSGRVGTKQISVKRSEAEADYVGVYMMARAGYDFRKAPLFWQRYAKDYGLGIFGDGTHPSWPKRVAAAEETVHEIERKRALGQPLVPNLPFFAQQQKPGG